MRRRAGDTGGLPAGMVFGRMVKEKGKDEEHTELFAAALHYQRLDCLLKEVSGIGEKFIILYSRRFLPQFWRVMHWIYGLYE